MHRKPRAHGALLVLFLLIVLSAPGVNGIRPPHPATPGPASGADFTTLRPTANSITTTSQSRRGQALRIAQVDGAWLVPMMTALVVIAVLLAALRLLIDLLCGQLHRRRMRRLDMAPPQYLGPVSVIVPAHNESARISATVRSLVGNDYPGLEVIVVDDGSTDGTADIVEALGLPGVFVIRQVNAGRPAALHAGVRYARHALLVLVDATTVVEKDTIGRLLQQLRDPAVDAVCGNTKVADRPGLPGRWQHLDQAGFSLDLRTFDIGRCLVTVPGGIGAVRRSAVENVDGDSARTRAEDVLQAGRRVVFEPAAMAWTEAPAPLHQRYRRALLQGDGRRGLSHLLLFQVLLPLTAPVVDIYAVYGLIYLRPAPVAAVWIGFTALQVATAGYALRLDREPYRPWYRLPLHQIAYRQLACLMVIKAIVTAIRGGASADETPDGAANSPLLSAGYFFEPPRPWTDTGSTDCRPQRNQRAGPTSASALPGNPAKAEQRYGEPGRRVNNRWPNN